MSDARILAREVLMSHPAAPVEEALPYTYTDAIARATEPGVVDGVMGEMARMTLMSVAQLAGARDISREVALAQLLARVDQLHEVLDDAGR